MFYIFEHDRQRALKQQTHILKTNKIILEDLKKGVKDESCSEEKRMKYEQKIKATEKRIKKARKKRLAIVQNVGDLVLFV